MRNRIRGRIRGSPSASGGITVFPQKQLYEELAFVAYHLHWPHEQLLDMEHAERLRWVDEVSDINQKLNDT